MIRVKGTSSDFCINHLPLKTVYANNTESLGQKKKKIKKINSLAESIITSPQKNYYYYTIQDI